jgi:integrase
MAREVLDAVVTDFYRPNELRALLEAADGPLRAVIALQGLAGLRLQKCLRLDWRQGFGIPGSIEVSSAKSKTRSRRLVEICPSLAAWLEPFRGREGRVWQGTETAQGYEHVFRKLLKSQGINWRKNGFRHGFCSYHFALHANENLTAALAGNSPAMIDAHYKGLATRAEAEKWFAVAPATAATNVIPLVTASATGAK